ncbi:MAG: hypothetical protein EOP04_23310 [Proteobacteria bacterium]|nr:MAG: hypothetical protein EOP04_23310 [Pseudomonadota bacterium]
MKLKDEIYISDNILKIAVDKARNAKKVLVRQHGTKYRMLDESFNPLINLTSGQFTRLTVTGILKYTSGNTYEFNTAARIVS